MMVLVETTKGLPSPSAEIFGDGAVQPLIHNPNKIPIENREQGTGNREQEEVVDNLRIRIDFILDFRQKPGCSREFCETELEQ
ncbi:hypothetical protein [Dapis sp. BLCC M229]|uniref:hypothetical protein n=1 Tax=Dapis sp. BLCC M229 TaxID=3400188 RepID=UPI003CFAF7EA